MYTHIQDCVKIKTYILTYTLHKNLKLSYKNLTKNTSNWLVTFNKNYFIVVKDSELKGTRTKDKNRETTKVPTKTRTREKFTKAWERRKMGRK